mgnify:CR=1 FL=1
MLHILQSLQALQVLTDTLWHQSRRYLSVRLRLVLLQVQVLLWVLAL